jgi:hypothetical protein
MEMLTGKDYRPQVFTVTIEGHEQQVVPKADWDNLKERHDDLKALVDNYERGNR